MPCVSAILGRNVWASLPAAGSGCESDRKCMFDTILIFKAGGKRGTKITTITLQHGALLTVYSRLSNQQTPSSYFKAGTILSK